MKIPLSSLEPFGYDIPTLVMVRMGTDPALIAKIRIACHDAFRSAIKQWKITQHYRKVGQQLPATLLNADTLKLFAKFAGGKNVECTIEDHRDFFYMSIEFNIEGDPTNYGSYIEYPDGENSGCEHTKV